MEVSVMTGQLPSSYEERMFINSDEAPTGVLVYYADGDEEIIHVNKYVVDLFECDSVEELMDLTGGTFRGFVLDEDIGATEDSIWGQVDELGNIDHIYYRIRTKTGRIRTIDDYGMLIKREGQRPIFNVFVAEMAQASMVDWLTGLPSMTRFHESARMGADTIRGRGKLPVAVALDFVGLKTYNTQYGRDSGDDLLREFGDLLRKYFGNEASSRFAEDHFYAFCEADDVEAKLESLFADFSKARNGKSLPVRTGIYACDPGDDIVAVGFDRAKFACDLDRKTWESRITWFSDEMRHDAQLRIHVLETVDTAIEQRWIRPYYQAQVRATTSRVCGEEALARWVDPVYGILPPSVFVPVLEESGLLHKLDIYIIDCVLEDLQTKLCTGIPIVPVSVNISLRDLGKLDIASVIIEKTNASGIDHRLINVEFTESAASDDSGLFREQVKALRDAGFQVWMDDFGSGYSSLNVLQSFSLDLIKLDMAFIRNMQDAKSFKIVEGVIDVANSLGVLTLAEGVETEEQANLLERAGCNIIQGYLYSQPASLETLIENHESGDLLPREPLDEAGYWNAIGALDLGKLPSTVSSPGAIDLQNEELPAGIMEMRDGKWLSIRMNEAYYRFFSYRREEEGVWTPLHAQTVPSGVDPDFERAAARALTTGEWERVAGKVEYGSGLQFFTKPFAHVGNATSFAVTAMPTMLGAALGAYGDVPMAYAVLCIVFDDTMSAVADAEYVYANSIYCDLCNYHQQELPGMSFNSLSGDEAPMWYEYFYRAAMLKEHVRDVVYSPEIKHWVNFSVSPSTMEGCITYAFTLADEEHKKQQKIVVDRDTSELIISIANVFNREKSYEKAMNNVLSMVSEIVHPDWLAIMERGESFTEVTFEWHSPASARQDRFTGFGNDTFMTWNRFLKVNEAIVVPDIDGLKETDESVYRAFSNFGMRNLLAVPLRSGSHVIGFIIASNYHFEKGVDTGRLLRRVASFISTRIANHRLVKTLEDTSMLDNLTGLKNRWGIDQCVDARLEEKPGEPYVLALIDVDDFKMLNDVHGHDVGDAMLKYLADTIVSKFSHDAIIGRNGGDEFLVMLFGEDAQNAEKVFEELTTAELSCDFEGTPYYASLSIGYVNYPEQAKDLKSCYGFADEALYAVKLGGKSGFRRYSPDLQSQYRTLLGFSSRDLADYIPGGIMTHKASEPFDVLYANEELLEITGCESLADFMAFTKGSACGFLHPDDVERVSDKLKRHAEEGKAWSKGFNDYRIIAKDGTVKHISANSRLVDVKGFGKLFYSIIVNRDERHPDGQVE